MRVNRKTGGIVLTAALATLAAACAGPDVPSFSPLAEGEERAFVDSEGNRIICRYEHETGSRLGSQVCLSEQRWAQLERDREQGRDQIQRSSERALGTQDNRSGSGPSGPTGGG